MANRPNSLSNPERHECGASLVALNRGPLADGPTARTSPHLEGSLLSTASPRRSQSMAAGLFFAVIVAVISVAAIFAISDPNPSVRGQPSSARPGQPSARPDHSSANDWKAGLIAQPAPQGSDLKGFVGFRGARCNSANPAVAIGRTTNSLIVVCQNYAGRFYYKGFGLRNGLSVEVDDSVQTGSRFIASTKGLQYMVSPKALVVTQGQNTLSDEPMLEYWSV
jgi:hypothetical protein